MISSSQVRGVFAALVLGAAATLTAGAVQAQDAHKHHTVLSADAIQWRPAPPSLPKGAQIAVLHGSPAQQGPFVIRLKFPAGFIVPPHRHSEDEFVTVISGSFTITPNETVDRAAIKPLPPGSFMHMPAGTAHYAFAETEAVVQVQGMGPFDVVYVKASDDPRKQN